MMVKKTTKKVMTKKKAAKVVRKKRIVTRYAVIDKATFEDKDPEISCDIHDTKTSYQHAVNSFLKHSGNEEDLTSMCVVEIKMMGKPMVKTTREITIKK